MTARKRQQSFSRSRNHNLLNKSSGPLNLHKSSGVLAPAMSSSLAAINGGVPRHAKQSRDDFIKLIEDHQMRKNAEGKNTEADVGAAKKEKKQLFEVNDFQIGLQIG